MFESWCCDESEVGKHEEVEFTDNCNFFKKKIMLEKSTAEASLFLSFLLSFSPPLSPCNRSRSVKYFDVICEPLDLSSFRLDSGPLGILLRAITCTMLTH